MIGISIILKDTIGNKVAKEIKKLDNKKNGENSYSVTFASEIISLDKEKFIGADLTVVFGGIKYDLRNAIIDSDVVINANSIFGGIEIYVPENVKIKVKSNSIFGGVNSKVNNILDEKVPTIYINGKVVFGGIEVKLK